MTAHAQTRKDAAVEASNLKQRPGQDIRIAGSGTLVHTLIQHDLIDEYRLLVYPVVLGSGKRLFEDVPDKLNLKFISTRTFPSGVIALIYQRDKNTV